MTTYPMTLPTYTWQRDCVQYKASDRNGNDKPNPLTTSQCSISWRLWHFRRTADEKGHWKRGDKGHGIYAHHTVR